MGVKSSRPDIVTGLARRGKRAAIVLGRGWEQLYVIVSTAQLQYHLYLVSSLQPAFRLAGCGGGQPQYHVLAWKILAIR